MCKILIDGDGCPVVYDTIALAQEYGVEVVLVCDTSHLYQSEYAQILIADKGKDQSDFLLLKHVRVHDLVITQDYGLAALVLAKGANALSQNAFRYTQENIEGLLSSRHQNAKLRKHKQYAHQSKRTKSDDDAFCALLCEELEMMEKQRK